MLKEVNKDFIENILDKMTLEQKVGGLFVVDFMGSIVTPYTVKMIREYHVAGLRVDTSTRAKMSYANDTNDEKLKKMFMELEIAPTGLCSDITGGKSAACTPGQYAATLNTLRDIAMERPLGIPVHTVLDQEGNGSENYALNNTRLFPCPMGLAATNDPELVYKASDAIARQLHAVGINWLHSPTVDVNVNHNNFEIGTRAYSDQHELVSRYALETLRAFTANKIVATGKHFPGRGDSALDAHIECPTINASKEDMYGIHLQPYIELIKEGLPAIMIAHTIFPALDDSGTPSTVSKKIVTDLLRKELGFDGVITTDNMLMGGIISKYGIIESCIGAIVAGQDLLLLRSQTPLVDKVYHAVLEAAKAGRITTERLNDANRQVLSLKYRYGLFENGGKVETENAFVPFEDENLVLIEKEVARKATLVRDVNGFLPLSKDAKILLVEQVHPTQKLLNNYQCHPSVLWEKMLLEAPNVVSVEITGDDEKNQQRVIRRLNEGDVIVATNYVERRSNKDISAFIRRLMKTGKPVIVVTNCPFEFGSPADFPAVINIFSGNHESLHAAAEIIFGKLKAQGVLPLRK
ncbi:MAG: hypothetical protein LBC80_01925 [Treponema sp.]|jgi:beta-N-acetylhexosaminidase|nr:hypothetical protein [Treponema sp.]